jgi:putative choline sulfate-utilization transcription factor
MAERPVRRLLNELAVFEAAARAAGFSAAGRELGLTQSAVSHHVAHLERALGARLFRRVWRGVTLTDAGATLYEAVRRGFSTIDAALDATRGAGKRRHLTVVTDFGFAAFWLIPRLDGLKVVAGGLDVHIVTTQSSAEFDLAAGDAAIAFGAGPRPGFEVTRLVDEVVVPVAGPAFLARYPASDLRAAPLLHLDMPGPGRWLSWLDYFRLQGWDPPSAPGGMAFNNYPLLMQAAIAGQGAALGWRPLIDQLLARELVVPLAPQVRIDTRGYELIVDSARVRNPDVLALFRGWLLEEFARGRSEAPT